MMKEREDIRRYSPEDIKAMHAQGLGIPTRANAPRYALEEDFWEKAYIVPANGAPSRPIPIDLEVLHWFESQGEDWRGLINEALRLYYEQHRTDSGAGN